MLEQLRTRKRELGGFGLVNNGTPGQRDCILADERAKGKNRSEKLCMKWIEKWEDGCFGAILHSIFCGPLRSQSWKSLEDEMLFAAESPEAKQVAMEKRVHSNALPVKQQHQVALIPNLLFNMTRPDVANRANVGKARLHPAISQRVWSPAQWADLNGGGIVLSSRMGPPGKVFAPGLFKLPHQEIFLRLVLPNSPNPAPETQPLQHQAEQHVVLL